MRQTKADAEKLKRVGKILINLVMKKFLFVMLIFTGISFYGKAQTVAFITSGGSSGSYVHWMPLALQSSGSGAEISEIKTDFKLFPNPCSDFIIVKGDFNKIEIFDTEGKLIKVSDKNKIDVSSFKPGVYMLKTEKNTETFVKNNY